MDLWRCKEERESELTADVHSALSSLYKLGVHKAQYALHGYTELHEQLVLRLHYLEPPSESRSLSCINITTE